MYTTTNPSHHDALAVHLNKMTGLKGDALLIFGGAVVTSICAQITVPIWPVPFTMQTFAVLLAGVSLGAKRGAMSQILYLLAGAAGAPVFASFHGGPIVFSGPTAGYLYAFPIAAGIAGFLAERGWDRKVSTTLVAMLLADCFILVFGSLWLAPFVEGFRDAWRLGAAPFVLTDLGKALVLTLLMPTAWNFVGRFERGNS